MRLKYEPSSETLHISAEASPPVQQANRIYALRAHDERICEFVRKVNIYIYI